MSLGQRGARSITHFAWVALSTPLGLNFLFCVCLCVIDQINLEFLFRSEIFDSAGNFKPD